MTWKRRCKSFRPFVCMFVCMFVCVCGAQLPVCIENCQSWVCVGRLQGLREREGERGMICDSMTVNPKVKCP